MKTAISVPDGDFERFERVAARHGFSRSEFYREAAARFADSLEGGSDLTRLADSALADAALTETADESFLTESDRQLRKVEW